MTDLMTNAPMDEPEMGMEAEAPEDPRAFVAWATGTLNLVSSMEDQALAQIGQDVIADWTADKDTMADWFDQMKAGLELAQLVKDQKTYPFKGASNIKFPLITTAALQFNARAYPAVVPGDRPVKVRVWGEDPGGEKAARADRVSEHMSYQLSDEVEEWEEETDSLLVQLPIVGTMVRKWWYDLGEERPTCRLLDADKFIVNQKVKNLNRAPRCTEEMPLYPHEIQKRINAGVFEDFDWNPDQEDKHAPQDFIEQHTRLDLDNDGYPEPYVVTVHCETKTVVRIVADFREQDVRYETEQRQTIEMRPVQTPYGERVMMPTPVTEEVPVRVRAIKRGSYFVTFRFMPSMNGDFHGIGLGLLLGDISKTINSTINMLLDAGKFATLGGGFLGSEFRMKGGSRRHEPGEWRPVEARGRDIREGVVALPYPGPNVTLFNLLGLLIEAGREVASVKDVVTGEMPRNQTATATLATIEQGLMVFTAVFKRIFAAMKKEFKLLAEINGETVSPEAYAQFHDGDYNPQEDYNLAGKDIQPVADPANVTKMQRAAKAQVVMELAQMGLVDMAEALNRIAEAMDIEDVESLQPQQDPAAEQVSALQMQMAQAELAEKAANIELTLAKVESERASAIESIAGAENDQVRTMIEQKKMRMEGLKALLEDERQRIAAALQASRGMAGTPGNPGSAGGGQSAAAAPQGSAGGQLLARDAGSGVYAGGPPDGGGVDGGLF